MDLRARRSVILLLVCVMSPLITLARATAGQETVIDWNPVMDAIIQVESEGNARAIKGNSCGAMQITPVLVRDCNRILRSRGSKHRFTLADRFSIDKSRAMFLVIQSYYNPTNSVEHAIRSWNGGQHYDRSSTQRYYSKVRRLIR